MTGRWTQTVGWSGSTVTLEVLRALVDRTRELGPETVVTVRATSDVREGSLVTISVNEFSAAPGGFGG